jgi:hypothetical protein
MSRAVTRANREAVAEAAWALALRLPSFGYAEIAAGMKISIDQATRIVQGWAALDALVVLQVGTGLRRLWQVRPGCERPVAPAPRGRSAEENLWTAMRGLRSFTPTDLAVHSCNDLVSVAPADAQAYCRVLLAGGYLRVERKASPARKQEAIYRLIRNSGPRPPRAVRVSAVVDDNTNSVVLLGDRS